jgi:hypothetical protein
MSVLAVIGPTALYLLYGWLLSAIVSQDISDRKGYGEKPGLASGLLLAVVGVVVWFAVPPRPGSPWSRYVRLPDLILAVLALLLFVLLFLNWYSNDSSYFEEFSLLELWGPLAVAFCYAQLHTRARGRASDTLSATVLGAAVVGAVMVILAILTPPTEADLEWPAYLALAVSIAMVAVAAIATRVDRSVREDITQSVAEARGAGAEPA